MNIAVREPNLEQTSRLARLNEPERTKLFSGNTKALYGLE
jgi:hypothetical protein